MAKWAEIKTRGVGRVDRVAAVFHVWSDGTLPFAKFKVKILERNDGAFLGVPNVAIRNPQTREPEFTSGLGKTVEEALADAIDYFMREVDQWAAGREMSDADFVWSSSEDF